MTKMDKIDEIVKLVRAQEEAGLAKAKTIIDDVKSVDISDFSIPDFIRKEEPAPKKKINWCLIFGVIAAILVVACVVYGLYRYFTPDYLDDFDDDFEDDEFEDDDFFEDEEEEDKE